MIQFKTIKSTFTHTQSQNRIRGFSGLRNSPHASSLRALLAGVGEFARKAPRTRALSTPVGVIHKKQSAPLPAERRVLAVCSAQQLLDREKATLPRPACCPPAARAPRLTAVLPGAPSPGALVCECPRCVLLYQGPLGRRMSPRYTARLKTSK